MAARSLSGGADVDVDCQRDLLKVTGLAAGEHEIRSEGRPIGTVDVEALALGVNLIALLLDGQRDAHWATLAQVIWEGKRLDEIGRTRWRYEVRRR